MMRAGATGFVVEDEDTNPALADDQVIVSSWIPADPSARERALAALAGERPELSWEEDPGWAHAWRAHFRPVRAGRLTVRAPWNDREEGSLEVVIEPAMAFGTGGHATTRLALLALQDVVGEGDRVLDVGCGSGVLAIASIKLGAAHAFGVDNDPEAVAAGRDNARLNGVGSVTGFGVGWPAGPHPVVVANIVSPVLLELRERLVDATAPRGHLILSGVLAEEADDVEGAFESSGLRTHRRSSFSADAEWTSITLAKA